MLYKVNVYDTSGFKFLQYHAGTDRRSAEFYANDMLECLAQDNYKMTFTEDGKTLVYSVHIKAEAKLHIPSAT